MAPTRAPSAALLRSLKTLLLDTSLGLRAFSISHAATQEQAVTRQSFYANPDPLTVHVPRLERKLARAGTPPIGSRRRRAAIASGPNIPFDELPYQCFQEARKILIDDRVEKLQKIEIERQRIARLQATGTKTIEDETYKQRRLKSMQLELENLKILADINDPNVKRRFEDRKGDMNKPIYRHLADRKWREYRRRILVQRITQLKVLPDVVPHIDPILDVGMAFGRRTIQPGDFVGSDLSEQPCTLTIQSFERGEKLLTIAIIDSDVPNLETDSFDSRCHFLATNIPITPTAPRVDLSSLDHTQILLPWTPPHAQKGSPYHRLSIVVLQHKDNIPMDVGVAMQKIQRHGFSTRSFMTRHMLTPVGATIFRIKWDETMADVMARAGIDGANVELKRKKVEPLPYKRRNPSSFR